LSAIVRDRSGDDPDLVENLIDLHTAAAKMRRNLLDPVEVGIVHGDRDTGHVWILRRRAALLGRLDKSGTDVN
jgi:hypothetical protein